jgi:Isochorismatase family
MSATDVLLKPEECVILLVDFQAGLGFGVESMPRQIVVNNAVALARTAATFKVPVIASTSATRVYSGPLLPGLQKALPSVKAIERRSMNVWEDDTARNAVVATNRKRLILTGLCKKGTASNSATWGVRGSRLFLNCSAPPAANPKFLTYSLQRISWQRI